LTDIRNKIDAQLIDVGTGNLHSVYNALIKSGHTIHITKDPEDLIKPGRFIMPGVGAFGSFMDGMKKLNMIEAVKEVSKRGDPLLGICVGMQALFDYSEEKGHNPGLSLIPGKVLRFPDFQNRKVPHTGWNQLWQKKHDKFTRSINDGSYAYFNHSYFCEPQNKENVILYTDYGIDFCSAVNHENIYGVQFHPEKSQQIGKTILNNFFMI